MKTVTATSIIATLLMGVAACTGRIVHMENEQGVHLTCEVSTTSTMLTGVLMRDGKIDQCVTKHEQAGFRITHEE